MSRSINDMTAEKFDHAGLAVRIVHDDEPAFNPRTDYDTPSVWHGEGGESRLNPAYADWSEWIREKRLAGSSVIPVRYADYGSSGARLYETDMDNANGAFVCDRETIKKEWGTGRGKFKGANGARNYMRGEVKEMDLCLQGYVFGIVIEGSGEQIESVWGFIGEPDADWIISEAKEMAEACAESIAKAEAAERRERRWAARQGIATLSAPVSAYRHGTPKPYPSTGSAPQALTAA
jgi:hypothetical protein